MHKLQHAQRRHIILSLETLLYQLHALSFFLSPSLSVLIFRCTSQFQFSRPREINQKRSLRFWFLMVLLFNVGSLWSHTTEGATRGPSVILDFIGMAYVPSKLHMVLLDLFIIFLEMVLTTIAYETSLAAAASATDTTDALMYIPRSPNPQSTSTSSETKESSSPYVLDFRLEAVIARLKDTSPAPRDTGRDELLPLPNTVPVELRESLRALMRTRAEVRARTQVDAQARTIEGRPTRVPGAMDTED